MWETPPPPWFDLSRGDLWGTIAIQDHGDRPFVYEEARKVPLGANMAARRSLFDAVGGFRADLGRSSGRRVLVPELNSGQLLWLLRAKYLAPAEGLNKVQGRPFLVSEIEAASEKML